MRARTCEPSPGRGAAIRKQQMVKYWTLLEIYSLHHSAPHLLPPSHTTPATYQPWVHAKQLFNLISPARPNSNFNLKGKHLKIPLARIFMTTSKGFIFNFCKCTEFGNYISEATIIKYKIQHILPQSNLN